MESIYLNDFKSSFRDYFPVDNVLYPDMHVLIYSNDPFLLDCYLHSNLKSLYDTTTTTKKQTYNDVDFEYNFNFTIFDMILLQSKFSDFVEYMNATGNNKILFDKKVHLIIRNIQVLNNHQQNVLATIIESQKSNSIVCTTINQSRTIEKLRSRLFCKRVVVDDMSRILNRYAKDQGIQDDNNGLVKEIAKEQKDLYSSVLHLHNGFHKNVIDTELANIIGTIKKTKNLQIYLSKIRECFYKLFIYNLPRQLLVHNIWKALHKKFKKNESILHFISRELSVLDHTLIFAAKPIYHYERFFLQVFKAVNSN